MGTVILLSFAGFVCLFAMVVILLRKKQTRNKNTGNNNTAADNRKDKGYYE